MKIHACLAVCLVLLLATIAPAAEVVLRVTAESASAEGAENVFTTIPAALTQVEILRNQAGGDALDLRIELEAGTYELYDGLVIDHRHAPGPGTLTLAASQNARLTGAVMLAEPSPLTDPDLLERIPQAAREQVVVFALPAARQSDLEAFPLMAPDLPGPGPIELFVGDQPWRIAQWPNAGYDRIAATPDQASRIQPSARPRFYVHDDHPARWSDWEPLRLHGFWAHDNYDAILPPVYIDDQERMIELFAPGMPRWGGVWRGQRWRALNVPEELDDAGEYWVDVAGARVLVVGPVAGTKAQPVRLALLADPLIFVEAPGPVVIEGLRLSHARGSGLRLQNRADVKVLRCVIGPLGGNGVETLNGARLRMSDCTVRGTGRGGIVLHGPSTIPPRTGNIIERCLVTDCGRWIRSSPAITLERTWGDRIAHCRIQQVPFSGIQAQAGNLTIAHNEIVACMLATSSGAGINIIGESSPLQTGILVKDNFIHDCHSFLADDAMGINIAQWAHDSVVAGNAIVRCDIGISHSGAAAVVLERNLVAFCPRGVEVGVPANVAEHFYGAEEYVWTPARHLTLWKAALGKTDADAFYAQHPVLARIVARLEEGENLDHIDNVVRGNVLVASALVVPEQAIENGLIQDDNQVLPASAFFADKGALWGRGAEAAGPWAIPDVPPAPAWLPPLLFSRLEVVQPLCYGKGRTLQPGKLALYLHNHSPIAVDGTATLLPSPVSSGQPLPAQAYRLDPGEEVRLLFSVETGLDVSSLLLSEWRAEDGALGSGRFVPVLHEATIPDLGAVASLEEAADLLMEKATPMPLMIGRVETAAVALGRTDEAIAMLIDVSDQVLQRDPDYFWHGSSVEAFFAIPGRERIDQFVLLPAAQGAPDEILVYRNGELQEGASIHYRMEVQRYGYRVVALIPASALGLNQIPDTFFFECAVNTTPHIDIPFVRRLLFDSAIPFSTSKRFGIMRVAASQEQPPTKE